MALWGENFVELEDGSGNILLESSNVVSFSDTIADTEDKLLLELSDSGASLENTEAQADSGHRFSVCMLSGFRALPGELVKSAYGALVLPRFSETRHPQELVRAKAESLEGSPRNEAPDVFITDEVTSDDL